MVLSPGAGIASAAGKIALRARAGGLSFPSGEGGQESKLKAGQGGDKEGKPPPLGTAAATPAANQPGTPPPGEWFALLPAPHGFSPGMQGAKPLA